MNTALILTGLVWLYFWPSIVAGFREHVNKTPILLLNIFLGWTFVGWVAALVWANTNNVVRA